MAAKEGDRGNFWQVVGRLGANVARLIEGQGQIKAEMEQLGKTRTTGLTARLTRSLAS